MSVAARLRDRADEGFTLVELMVSLLLVALVMSAALSLFVHSLMAASWQSQRQQALALAQKQMETVRTTPVASLLTGRSKALVDALWADPGVVSTSGSLEAYDASSTSSDACAATLPTVQFADGCSSPSGTTDRSALAGVNGVKFATAYTVRTFVDKCYVAAGTGSSASAVTCTATQATGATAIYRVTVGITWAPGRGQRCKGTGGVCGYALTSYIDGSSDPTFNNS